MAAEKEFDMMSRAHDAGVSVPRPIHQNRHVVVMGYIDGYNLVDVNTLDDPIGFLEDILLNARKAYGAGIIHGDLSSFNIVVQKNGEVLLIDWPQAVATDHPNAEAFLERDVTNVLRYFERKFDVERGPEEAIAYVKG